MGKHIKQVKILAHTDSTELERRANAEMQALQDRDYHVLDVKISGATCGESDDLRSRMYLLITYVMLADDL